MENTYLVTACYETSFHEPDSTQPVTVIVTNVKDEDEALVKADAYFIENYVTEGYGDHPDHAFYNYQVLLLNQIPKI